MEQLESLKALYLTAGGIIFFGILVLILVQAGYIIYLKTIPYDIYLKSFHWKYMRRKALKRAGYRSQLTFKKPTKKDYAVVHHRDYRFRGVWFLEHHDLIVLLNSEHQVIHGEFTLVYQRNGKKHVYSKKH